jgi:hypothetical protein
MDELKQTIVMEALDTPIIADSKLSFDESIPTVASIKNVITEVTQEKNIHEFSRANIEALGNTVRLVDSDESIGLDLFCYVRCGPTDEGLIRQCRGVVFHEQKMVMKAFPYTTEYNHTDTESIEEHINTVFKECSFYDAHEGALIRMFNFEGKWLTSTHRKLNAFRSKWASRESFGTIFKRALESELENNTALRESLPVTDDGILERFQSTLDITKQYMFLIRNTQENRIVCMPPSRPTFYHVGTFVDGELVMTEKINVPYPTHHKFSNSKELIEYVNNADPIYFQGVIVFAPDNKQYKILNKNYQDLFQARGNEPSIKFRYLQVRMDRKLVDMLFYLYPDFTPYFDDYENTLYDIAVSIHSAYVQRFMKKQYISMPREEYAIMRDCHTWHLEDRDNNRMTLEKVIHMLNLQSPTNLNHMIRRYKTDERKAELKDSSDNLKVSSQTEQPSSLLTKKNYNASI